MDTEQPFSVGALNFLFVTFLGLRPENLMKIAQLNPA